LSSTDAGDSTALMAYGPPLTVSPAVLVYAAATLSAGRNPPSVPEKAGSAVPYTFVAAFGVTDAAAFVIVNAAVLLVIA
jgi:hypothetical protein